MTIRFRSSVEYKFIDSWRKYLPNIDTDIDIHFDPYLDIDISKFNILYYHNISSNPISQFNGIYRLDLYDAFVFVSDQLANVCMNDKLEHYITIPFAADHQIYYPSQYDVQFDNKVIYTGKYIRDFDIEVSVYNTDNLPIKYKHWHKGFVAHEDMRYLYNSCIAHLVYHSDNNIIYSIHNEELYESLACGTCVISDLPIDNVTINLGSDITNDIIKNAKNSAYNYSITNTYEYRMNKLHKWLIDIC